MRAMTIRSQIH